ncbi:30S ribosomal protein S15 [Candidatus Woesearchaeota archaeon]|nr:30S ribosomal protein S15 [Candidatus Woesearchaeota archaeon]
MARMHSRKRGKSSSKKPSTTNTPVWVSYKPQELEMIISKLAKEGKSTAEIGTILRDTYGIPDVRLLFKAKLLKVVEKAGVQVEIPEDLVSLIRRSVQIRKHMEANNKDQTAKRGLQLTESKIKRLTKYYKKSGKLSSEWKYDPERAGFFMK